MGNVLGSLFVELGINTAAFVEGVNKATYSAKAGAQQIGSAFKGIGSVLSELGSEFGQFGGIVGSALGSAGTAMSKVAKEFLEGGGGIGKALGLAGVAAIGLGAAAATAGAAAIGIAVHAAEGASRLHELSQSTGVAVQELSGLAVVAKLVGIDVETLAKGLEKMDKSALAAAQNPQKASNAYRTLGISVTDSSGHIKSATDLFGEVADKFSAMEDGATKTALAMQIFGRAGASLIPVLNKGGDAMKYWIDYGTRVGAVLSEEAAAGAHNFEEQMTKLSLISEGVQNKLMAALLPAIDHVVVAFTSFVEKGDTIAHFGEVVGSVIVSLAKIVFEAAFAWDWWGSKLDIWRAKYERLKLAIESKVTGVKIDTSYLDKEIADSEAKIQKANDRLAVELADLGSKVITPAGPGGKKDNKSPAPAVTAKGTIVKPEKDFVGDLIAKAEIATAAEVALAGAIGESTAALLIQKAVSAATIKIDETKLQITDRLKILQEEEASAAKTGAAGKVAAIRSQESALRSQLSLLESSRGRLVALFETKAVATFAAEIGKQFESTNEKLKEQIVGLNAMAVAAKQGGTAVIAAGIEEKLAGDKQKINELSAAFALLSKDEKASAQDLVSLAIAMTKANSALDEHRTLLQQEHAAQIAVEAAHYSTTARLADETTKFGELMAATKDADAQLVILAQHQAKMNSITGEWDKAAIQVGTFSQKVKALLNELAIENQNVGATIFASIKKGVDGLSTQLADMVVKGKGNFKDLFASLEAEVFKALMSAALNSLITKMSKLFMGGSNSDNSDNNSGGGIGGFFSALFGGGGKAGGGPVAPGVSYLVGEKGPERFVPDSPGTIIPADKTTTGPSGLSATVHINVHGASDVDSFRKAGPQVASEMFRNLQMAHAHNGGSF